MKEIDTENDHVQEARDLGAVCIKGKVEGRAAFPDQLVLKPVGFYWIEFKTKRGSLQDDQAVLHKILREKGHTVYVCDDPLYSRIVLDQEFDR